MIAVVVALNAWIGFRQEYRAERAIAALQAMAMPTASVVRGGRRRERLGLRDRSRRPRRPRSRRDGPRRRARRRGARAADRGVGADRRVGAGRQASASGRRLDASSPSRRSMAFSGTSVAAGRGRILVTATGMDAELGRVAELLRGAGATKTPLQQRLDVLVRRLGLAAGVIVLVVFAIEAARGESLDDAAAQRRQPRRRGDPREPPGGRHDHADAGRPADAEAATR